MDVLVVRVYFGAIYAFVVILYPFHIDYISSNMKLVIMSNNDLFKSCLLPDKNKRSNQLLNHFVFVFVFVLNEGLSILHDTCFLI